MNNNRRRDFGGGASDEGDDVLALSKGAPVFVRVATDIHSLGTLLEKPSAEGGSDCLVQLSDEDSPRRVSIRDIAPANVMSSSSSNDVCSLSFLHEPAVTHCLRVRYSRNEIYTRAGPVLVAVNPFRNLQGLYSAETAARYAEQEGRAVALAAATLPPALPPLPPHIFETASRAYSAMVSSGGRSQSIIISGESGAGKTESAKLALRQVAALAAASSSLGSASVSAAAGDEFAALEAAILATNPVLESFGNAKTSRNSNSSRFGKLVELLYCKGGGGAFAVSGARLSTCLLERSRLVERPPGERNFHVLYQLVAGAGDELREELRLPPPAVKALGGAAAADDDESSPPPPQQQQQQQQTSRYLSGGPSRIEGVDDAAEFRKVCEALSALGVGEETGEQKALWRALAAVLHLGDVEFEATEEGEACRVSREVGNSSSVALPLETAAELLGVRAEELERVLTTREITAGGGKRERSNGRRNSRSGGNGGKGIDLVVRKLRPEEARSSRDALAKAVYSSLFDWLVARINRRLAPPRAGEEEDKEAGTAAAADAATSFSSSISLLDIYGFECFEENGFEQLCINYANEHLQAQFNSVLLALEQEAYEGEGVDFSRVEWRSNEDTLVALDARPGNVGSASASSSPRFAVGLLALLDEACLVPGGTDAGFGLRVSEVLAGGGAGSSSSSSSAASTPSSAKAVSAAAFSSTAVVTGCPAGAGASFSVAHAAGNVSYSTRGFLAKNKDVVSAEALALLSKFSTEPLLKEIAAATTTAGSKSANSNSTMTVVSAFRSQLRSLLSRLDSSQLHFVRCIKPNSKAAPSTFDSALVAHQLRNAGVAEVARVARQGFPTRASYGELARRFGAAFREPSSSRGGAGGGDDGDDKAVVAALLSSAVLKGRLLGSGNDGDAYALGRTKVFMRAGVMAALEAELRVRSSAATAISSRFRGRKERVHFLKLRHSAVAIQAAARGKAARRLLVEKKKEKARREKEVEKRRAEEEEAEKRRAEEEEAERAKAEAAAKVSSAERSSLSSSSSTGNAAAVLRGAEKLVEAADAEAAAAAKRAASGGDAEESKRSSSNKWLPKVPLSLRRSSRSNEGSCGVAAATPRPPPATATEIALWETYSERLEAQVAGLLAANRALQGSLAASRADAARAARAAANGNTGGGKKMSCFSSSSSRPSSAASPSPTQSAAAEHAASLRALDALRESLGNREALFEDDAAFLEEVASGSVAVAAAPGFHLREETRRLRKRFQSFVSSFKGKMEATEVVVLGAAEAKRAREEAAEAAVGGGGGGGESRREVLIAAASPLDGGKAATTAGAAPVVSLEARAAW